MTTTRLSLRAAAMILIIFALFATACGGSEAEDAASDAVETATDDSNDDEESDDANDSDSGDGESSGSPLDEFLGVPSFDPEDPEASQVQFEEEERKRQEAVAGCMRAEGFEYTPEDPSQYSFFGDEGGLDWGSKEWVEKFGYGISTQSFSQGEVGPDLIGYDDSQFGGDDFSPEDDPNYVYMSSLSEAEQMAYQEALYGQEPDIDFDALTEEEIDAVFQDFEFGGCQNQTQEEGEFGKQQAFYEEFGDQMDEMYEAMQDDPRVLEVEADIEACVADKGIVYVSEQDAYELWEDKLSPIRDRTYQQFEEDPLDAAAAETMSDAEIREFYESLPQPELSDEDKVLLGEMQAEEIAMAVASFECGGGYSNQDDLFNDLRVEYEQRFLEENGAALEAFSAAN